MKASGLAGLLLLHTALVSAQFSGSENFSGSGKDSQKWGADIQFGSGQLSQSGDGLLRFSCAGNTDDDAMAWPWTVGRAPQDSDWSIQLDVHVPFIPLAEGFAAVGIGLGVRNSADGTDRFGMSLEQERSPGESQDFHFFNDLKINNTTTETSAAASNPNGAVRISWNAATQTLSAQYDIDGNVNGYSWTQLQTFQPVSGWGMTGTDNFEIYVVGFGENTAVTLQQNVYADDFIVSDSASSSSGSGNLAGFDDFNDNSKDTSHWGPDDASADHSLTEVSQRLEYTSLNTTPGYSCRPWILNTGSYTGDWETLVDVHLPNLNLTADGQEARLYLQASSGDSSANIQLELTREAGTTMRRFRWENEGPGGGGMSLATTSTDASLRIAYDAGSKTLNFYHDNNGSSGGYEWNFLGSLDLDAAGTDWELTSDSRFDIALCGESAGIPIGITDVYADNFRAFSHNSGPNLAGYTGRDDFAAVGRNTTKWGTPLKFGSGLLTQSGDGVVRFSSSPGTGSDEDEVMAWPWIGDAPFASDWSIQADVHIPHIPLTPGHTATGMGIGVRHSADTTDTFFMHLENVRSDGPQMFNFFNSLDINDNTTEFSTPASSRLGSVRVSWNATTKLLSAEYDVDGAVGGYNWQLLNTFNPVTGGWNMTATGKFKILLAGYSEVDGVPITANMFADNFYAFGTPVTITPPVAKTLAAASISHDSATLNGIVNAKGSERAITFDYGTTTSLGSSIAAMPDRLDTSQDTPVTATLTGLQPHTKYYFRVRAAGQSGATNGTTMSFTTLNRAPTAQADGYTVTAGAVVPLPVLDNDEDPDDDALLLGSYSALSPATAGKLSKSGNTLIFTAATNFTGATFTYAAKDALGLTSPAVTVTLTAGECMISPPTASPASAPITYPINITSDGAWSVTEKLSWVTVSPSSGSGDGVVQVSVQPHTGKQPRIGSLFIGGQEHLITQDHVYQPALSQPNQILPGIVSGYYELDIPTQNLPVTYTVTNLPPGLKLDGNLGLLSGYPTKGGNYPMTIKARNAAGVATETLSFTIVIAELLPKVYGSFHGLVGREDALNQKLGSRLELSITNTGAISGKCFTGTAALPFTGKLASDVDDQEHPSALINIPRPKQTALTLNLTFDGQDGAFEGFLSDPASHKADVEGWRNPWHAKNKVPAYYRKLHTFVLLQPQPGTGLPQGHSYASFTTVTEGTGAIQVMGKLADGNKLMCSSFVGQNGEILLYVPLYNNRGSVAGRLNLTPHDAAIPDNAIAGAPTWYKAGPLANSKDTLYQAGFGPLVLDAEGDAYPPPPPGGLLFGMTSADPEAQLEFSNGGLETESKEFTQELTLTNSSATGLTNIATLTTPIQNSLKLTVLTTSTGAFRGEFVLAGASAAQNRKVPFEGLIVSRPGGVRGYGYFILPESTSASATRRSGAVLFSPEPP